MPITDPQAVKFCNEKVRPIADRYAQLYWLSKIFLTERAAAAAASVSQVMEGWRQSNGVLRWI
jgi:hypothetical protein